MSNSTLFTVTLTDLASYRVTVAAATAEDACSIAKTVLYEEATPLAPGLTIAKREVDAFAEPAPEPSRQYRVHGTYSVEFSITVPANDGEDAERHARRIYAEMPFAWEHDIAEDCVRWRYAEAV